MFDALKYKYFGLPLSRSTNTSYFNTPAPWYWYISQHNFYIVPSKIRMSPVTMAEIFVASWWAADLGWTFTALPTCSISEYVISEQAVPSQSHNPSFLHCFFFFLKEQAFGSLLTPYPWPFCAPLALPSSYLGNLIHFWWKVDTLLMESLKEVRLQCNLRGNFCCRTAIGQYQLIK